MFYHESLKRQGEPEGHHERAWPGAAVIFGRRGPPGAGLAAAARAGVCEGRGGGRRAGRERGGGVTMHFCPGWLYWASQAQRNGLLLRGASRHEAVRARTLGGPHVGHRGALSRLPAFLFFRVGLVRDQWSRSKIPKSSNSEEFDSVSILSRSRSWGIFSVIHSGPPKSGQGAGNSTEL